VSDHHHHHDHSGPIAIGATAARVVIGLLAGIGLLVVIGAVWLWPSHQHIDIPLPMQNGGGGAIHTEAGTVTMQDVGPCGSPSGGKAFADTPQPPAGDTYTCQRSLVSIDSGSDQGKHTLLEIPPGPDQPRLQAGDHIRLARQNDPSGVPTYSFEDYSRGLPLILIAIVFVVVIVVVARWRGLRAVLGLGFAFAVLVLFMLPALLDGKPALPVALVAGAVILYAVLYLAHGVNLRTSSALLGTLSAMVLAAVLSWAALRITHVTGLSEEQNTNVATYVQHVSITGLLLAGFIIGSLGVLNDVTITQASAAFELAAIDDKASRREIFLAAMRVGRDHIASTVYTLVLAYAGGALPLLLLFSVAGRSFHDVLTSDAVATEIARSAVGGICLALSVPLTTAIAVLLARPFGNRPAPEAAPVRRRATGGHYADNSDNDNSDNDEKRPPRRPATPSGRRHAGPATGVATRGNPPPGEPSRRAPEYPGDAGPYTAHYPTDSYPSRQPDPFGTPTPEVSRPYSPRAPDPGSAPSGRHAATDPAPQFDAFGSGDYATGYSSSPDHSGTNLAADYSPRHGADPASRHYGEHIHDQSPDEESDPAPSFDQPGADPGNYPRQHRYRQDEY
jgi:uncharacterized membrane protein